MPINHSVNERLELFVMRFSGTVTEAEICASIARVAADLPPDGSFRSLLIFDRSTDLSAIDKDVLQSVQDRARDTLYRIPHRERRGGAAMIDGSLDAKFILPLWNALSHSDPEIDMHYDIFTTLDSALNWLEIPKGQGLSLIRGTEQTVND